MATLVPSREKEGATDRIPLPLLHAMTFEVYDITESVLRARKDPNEPIYKTIQAAKACLDEDSEAHKAFAVQVMDMIRKEGEFVVGAEDIATLNNLMRPWLKLQSSTRHVVVCKDGFMPVVRTLRHCDCKNCRQLRASANNPKAKYDA